MCIRDSFEADGAYNVTKGQALLEGYDGMRRLGDAEIAALPVLTRGAAMRFLLTRLYDWIHIPDTSFVTKKDPKEYLRKNRFYRQVKRPAELGLMRDATLS